MQPARFIEILRRALDEELARDPAVHLLGEDVAARAAPLASPRAWRTKHRAAPRVRNTPISEAAITGLATGAALCGLKLPCLKSMFIDFATLSMDCLVKTRLRSTRYMSGGQLAGADGAGTHAGGCRGRSRRVQHSQSLEAWFIPRAGAHRRGPVDAGRGVPGL